MKLKVLPGDPHHIADRIPDRIQEIPVRELDDAGAHRITRELARQGIHVEPVVSVLGVLHLWAKRPLDTRAEVRIIAAFKAETDCRLAYHPHDEECRS